MDAYPIPVQVLSVCDTQGRITPVRFRLETPEHELLTFHILQVISENVVQYVGIEAMVYLCKAKMSGRERLFELRYTVRSHKWMLHRMIT